jgi:thioredoxin-related protein
MIRSIFVLMLFFTANCLLHAQRNKDTKPVERVERTKSESTPHRQSVSPTRNQSTQSTTERSTTGSSTTRSTTRSNTEKTTTHATPRGNTNASSPGKAQTLGPNDGKSTGSKTSPSAPVVNVGNGTSAPEVKIVQVNWMTLDEAVAKSKIEKKKIFIDVYTDWCGWCKRMDETTFTDARVADYLNKNFYAVKFNAEQQQDIVFKDKTYHFKKVGTRGYHELAAEWLNNRLSYPTVVFLNEDLELIQPLPNYVEAARFETIITYFGTNSYKKTPWETYEKNFVNNRN